MKSSRSEGVDTEGNKEEEAAPHESQQEPGCIREGMMCSGVKRRWGSCSVASAPHPVAA